jgi:hypothetical protein
MTLASTLDPIFRMMMESNKKYMLHIYKQFVLLTFVTFVKKFYN